MKTTIIDVQQLQPQMRDLISLAAAGTEVLLVDGKQPLARIVPMARVPGLHPGEMVASEDFDEPLPESFWSGKP